MSQLTKVLIPLLVLAILYLGSVSAPYILRYGAFFITHGFM